MAARGTGRYVATRAVLTTNTGEHDDDNQQDQDEADDPKHFHPAWCSGIGGAGQPCACPPLSRVGVKVIVTAEVSFSPSWPREDYAGCLLAILLSAVPKKIHGAL